MDYPVIYCYRAPFVLLGIGFHCVAFFVREPCSIGIRIMERQNVGYVNTKEGKYCPARDTLLGLEHPGQRDLCQSFQRNIPSGYCVSTKGTKFLNEYSASDLRRRVCPS